MLQNINPEKKYTKTEISKSYVKYVLEKGTKFEKTRLVKNFDSKPTAYKREIIIIG